MRMLYISKYYLLLGLLPVAGLIWALLPTALNIQSPAGKIIVIDAGHGGIDPGANRPGIQEKDINLAIALQLRDILKQQDVKVVMTRDADVELSDLCDNNKVQGRYHRDLSARLEMIQESDADLFVSIHTNASAKSKGKGISCYYAGKSEAGQKLALAIQEQLRTVAPISQEAKPANFFVLRRNKVPAVLVEVGFITNSEDRALLENPDYQKKIAEAVGLGIAKYYQPHFLSHINGE